MPEALHARLREGGAVTFASAAALTLGLVTIPVYEVYKVGEDPRWLDGLDVLGAATGLRAAVVPHYNNAEGGTHDTRFCWQGERRLRVLESLLPEGAFVLGVDEHTGLVIDLDSGSAEVVGRGTVVVRVHGDEWVVPTGETITVEQIAAHGRSELAPVIASASTASTSYDGARRSTRRSRVATSPARSHWSASSTGEPTRPPRARPCARCSPAPPRPWASRSTSRRRSVRYVELLLTLRGSARADKRFADSDAIRDGLAAAGIEVRDTADGVTWEVRP